MVCIASLANSRRGTCAPGIILANAGWEYIGISEFESRLLHQIYGGELSPILSPENQHSMANACGSTSPPIRRLRGDTLNSRNAGGTLSLLLSPFHSLRRMRMELHHLVSARSRVQLPPAPTILWGSSSVSRARTLFRQILVVAKNRI